MGLELSPRPVPVKQGAGPLCWAAAVRSWLTVNAERPQLNKQQLIDRYGNPKKGGSISFQDEGWTRLFEDMNLDSTLVLHPVAANAITFFEKVQARLGNFGYLILIFNHKKGVSHAMTLFGIRTLPNLGAVLHVMDPTVGDHIFFQIDRLFDLPVVIINSRERLNASRKIFPEFTTLPDGPPISDK
jgi:hypothetical protein